MWDKTSHTYQMLPITFKATEWDFVRMLIILSLCMFFALPSFQTLKFYGPFVGAMKNIIYGYFHHNLVQCHVYESLSDNKVEENSIMLP